MLLHQITFESTTSGFSGVGNLPFRISLSSCLFVHVLLDTVILEEIQGRLEAAVLKQTNRTFCLLVVIIFFQRVKASCLFAEKQNFNKWLNFSQMENLELNPSMVSGNSDISRASFHSGNNTNSCTSSYSLYL